MAWKSTPKGFQGQAQVTPVKQGSYYTAGVFNNSLGSATAVETGKSYNRYGWLHFKTTPYSQTGKQFSLDFAFWGDTGYFNLTGPAVKFDIKFYSTITKSFDSNWYTLSNEGFGPFTLCTYTGDISGTSAALWNNYRTFGQHKPAYGVVVVNDVTASDYSTYAEYCAAVPDKTKWGHWDPSPGYESLVGKMPLGVRYISNNGSWGPATYHPNPSGVVTRDFQNVQSVPWSQVNLDGGNSPSKYKSFTITADLIKKVHGTVTGVTAFQLRITAAGGFVYYFGSNNTTNPESGQGIYTMIDNPQLGLLEYGKAGAAEDWPPRYDAKAYHITGSGNVELAAQYNDGNGSGWNIF